MDDTVICTRTQKKTLTRCMSVSIRQPSLVTMQLHKLCHARQVSRLCAIALHGDGIARASHPSSLLCLHSRWGILSPFRLLRRPPDVLYVIRIDYTLRLRSLQPEQTDITHHFRKQCLPSHPSYSAELSALWPEELPWYKSPDAK